MPYQPTGQPPGRRPGKIKFDQLCEDALFIGLSAAVDIRRLDIPVAHLSKLIADPAARMFTEKFGNKFVSSILPDEALGDGQFAQKLKYSAQKRNGSHGPPYLAGTQSTAFLEISAHLVCAMFLARNVYIMEYLGGMLIQMGWVQPAVDKLRWVSLIRLAADDSDSSTNTRLTIGNGMRDSA
jgi:hypothetical protein